tara:strand:- start:14130 stop:15350 length:1221 start_codon:yes stop_codon:yes gene_type:complete
MNKLLIILSISFLFSYDSYISFYGSGEKLSKLNPSNISLGWSKLFDSNTYHRIGSLSNLYESDMVRLSMASDFNFNSVNENLYFSQKFNYFSFLFPIKKNKHSLGLSLSPFYRINSNIIESEFSFVEGNEDNPPYAYKTEYDFSGGPSIASAMLSSLAFNKNNFKISCGLQLNYIFGSLYSYIKHSTYNINYDQDGNINPSNEDTEDYTTISSYDGYGFEMQVSIKSKKNEFVGSFNMVDNININYSFYDDIIPEALELGISPDEETTYKFSSPFEFNIGYAYHFNQNNTFILEYYNYNPYDSNSDFNLFNNSDVNKNRVSIGYYKNLFNNNARISSGLYSIETYNDFLTSNKKGMTIGLGIYSIDNLSMDFCLEFGQNKIEINDSLSEKYVNLYIGLTAADKWFK